MTGKEALKEVIIEQQTLISEVIDPENHKSSKEIMELYDVISKELDEADSLKNMLHNINLCEVLQPDVDDFKKLELLEQLETLKYYYPPFKLFLKDMFEKGYNKDLNKVKEWLEND